jgi:hypothetical protein
MLNGRYSGRLISGAFDKAWQVRSDGTPGADAPHKLEHQVQGRARMGSLKLEDSRCA